jgi:Domain of unknown function (DUF4193)
MRSAARNREPAEAHYTEGELDLEPPEELAIGELDEQTMLEEELDNEDVLEQDVDEDTLELALEDLVHGGDDDDGDDDQDSELHVVHDAFTTAPRGGPDLAQDSDDDAEEEDVEEGLDLVLLERLALVDLNGNEDTTIDGAAIVHRLDDSVDLVDVAPCASDEFVCRSCFLVRTRVQLVDATAMVCRDCST